MEENKYKPNIYIKKLMVFILTTIVICYISYVIYELIKKPTNIFIVEYGDIYEEECQETYILRDEIILQGENYKNGIEKIKPEGEKVAKQEEVFRYYNKNEETLIKKISELDVKIQKVMENQEGIYSSDIKNIEAQIDKKINQIHGELNSNKLEEYKKELDSMITKKAKIIGDNSPKGSYLNDLIEQRRGYESELNSGAEHINSPISGIVSYKVDGLEERLKTTEEFLTTLTLEYLEDLKLKTGKIVPDSEEKAKVVDNTYLYLAISSDSENAKNVEIGKNVKLRLQEEILVSAKLEYKVGKILIFKTFDKVEKLTAYRKITADIIWWSDSGLKVPNEAIIEKDGLKYVTRNRAGYLTQLLIKVDKSNQQYSLVRPYTTQELKEMGYSTKEILNYRKIAVYDEIILEVKEEE